MKESESKAYWLMKIEIEEAKEYFLWLVSEMENGFNIRVAKK